MKKNIVYPYVEGSVVSIVSFVFPHQPEVKKKKRKGWKNKWKEFCHTTMYR